MIELSRHGHRMHRGDVLVAEAVGNISPRDKLRMEASAQVFGLGCAAPTTGALHEVGRRCRPGCPAKGGPSSRPLGVRGKGAHSRARPPSWP